MITRPLSLNHIAYPTWDSAATYRFYTEVLRCEFIAAIQLDTVPSTGANTPYLHTFYRLQRGGCIAFFEVDGLDEPAPDGIPAWIRHLALDVASLEELSEWRDHFEAHGLSPVGIVDHDGVWESLYIFDPQGVRIELTVQNRPLGESDRESGLQTLAQWAVRHGQDFTAAEPREGTREARSITAAERQEGSGRASGTSHQCRSAIGSANGIASETRPDDARSATA